MKRLRLPLLTALAALLLPLCAVAAPDAATPPAAPAIRNSVVSAHVACGRHWQGKEVHTIDPAYTGTNFADCFAGINLATLRSNTEDGVFGYPIDMLILTQKRAYILCVNNTHGVFSLFRATEISPGHYIVTQRGQSTARSIHHAELYDKLRAAGLNILSEEQLLQAFRQHKSREAREAWQQQYQKVLPPTR